MVIARRRGTRVELVELALTVRPWHWRRAVLVAIASAPPGATPALGNDAAAAAWSVIMVIARRRGTRVEPAPRCLALRLGQRLIA